MATLGFDIPTKLATVAAPDTSISVQEIVDQFRDFEDNPLTMAHDGYEGTALLFAEGKSPVGGGAEQVITAHLLNGWRIKFEDRAGPTTIECSVTGGNLIAWVQEFGGTTQIPVAPSTYVFPSYAQATTGALLGSLAPEFQGGVWVDGVSGVSGTAFPTGTSSQPVSNFPDAFTIAAEYGLRVFKIIDDTSCSGSDLSGGYRFEAAGSDSTLTFTNCDLTDAEFDHLILAGSNSGGDFEVRDGALSANMTGIRGLFGGCELRGKIFLSGDATFVDCFSTVRTVSGHAGIDGGLIGGLVIQVRRFSGGLDLYRFVTTDIVSVDLAPGHVKIEPDCTGGDYKFRGIGEPVTIEGSYDTLDDDGFIDGTLMDVSWGQKILRESGNPASEPGYLLIYTDAATPVYLGYKELYADEAKTTGWTTGNIMFEGPLKAGNPPFGPAPP